MGFKPAIDAPHDLLMPCGHPLAASAATVRPASASFSTSDFESAGSQVVIGSCFTAPPRFESFSLVGAACLGAVMAAHGAASAKSSARRMVAAASCGPGSRRDGATDGRLLAKSCSES